MDGQTQAKGTSTPSAQQLSERVVEGKRDALLDLFARAGTVLSDDDRARIQACNDADTLSRWIGNAQEYVTSDREADLFELQLHQGLASRQARAGWCFMLVASGSFFFLLVRPLLGLATLGPEDVGRGVVYLVVLLSIGAKGVSYLRKASMHREQAEEIEHRIRKRRGSDVLDR